LGKWLLKERDFLAGEDLGRPLSAVADD
jgi:hypothetical protein